MKVIVSEPQIPEHTKVTLKLEVTAELNVSLEVARRRANRFLMMTIGNLLHAGEPELVISQKMFWRVPILYSLPHIGLLGKVGEVLVDVENGDVSLAELTTEESIERNVEALYLSSPVSTREEL